MKCECEEKKNKWMNKQMKDNDLIMRIKKLINNDMYHY